MHSAARFVKLIPMLFLVGCGRSAETDLIDRADAGLTSDAGFASDAGPDLQTRDAGAGCDCLSGRYAVTRTVCVIDDCSATYTFTDTLEVAACNGTVVCHLEGVVRQCMTTEDNVFRVYKDTLGYEQYIFSSRSCGAPWKGVYASEGGGGRDVTATLIP